MRESQKTFKRIGLYYLAKINASRVLANAITKVILERISLSLPIFPYIEL